MTDAAMDLCELSMTEAARRIRAGEVSAEAYCRALLERCEAGRSLNAFLALDPERVLAEARRADRRRKRGKAPGVLDGVPLAVKDAVDVAGMPTTGGTPALANNVPDETAAALRPLFAAGAILLGKTNLPELGFAVTGNNEFTGPVRNPYDPARSPGGSSAGTAAAVAARMAPAGIGTDTSGSVRIPAAFCGLVGFRPSTGRYPAAGILPMNRSRDTLGFMARSVGDVAALDGLLVPGAPLGPRPLEGLRLGIARDYFFAGVDGRIAAVVDAELSRLERAGVELVAVAGPDFAAVRSETTLPVMRVEFRRDLAQYLEDVGAGVSVEAVVASIASPYVKSELETVFADAGPELARQYQRAVTGIIPGHRAAYRAWFREHGLTAIALPTAPLLPAAVGEARRARLDGAAVSIWRTLRNAVPASVLGAPGLTLPVGTTADGLPVGLELDGLPGGDRELLGLGLAWARSGPARMPPPPGFVTH